MTRPTLPMPPLAMRRIVGPTEPETFDNASGTPIYEAFGLDSRLYDAIFDFGCGCGRLARQLLQQTPRPRRYVGIDVHPEMIRWCREHLSPVDTAFQFFHHDVYSPTYAPGNSRRLAEPFPVEDRAFSLVLAHSVFTHLYRRQSDYYLHEVARILAPGGLAYTTWFFFDRDGFPFLREGPYCLFTSEVDPSQAVIYDRRWFLDMVNRVGLCVARTIPPLVAGHQWIVFLATRAADSVDRFPLGDEAAEWLSGATVRPRAAPAVTPEIVASNQVGSSESLEASDWPKRPALFGALAELELLRQSLPWKLWHGATAAVRRLRR